jgi:hypothetical protein
MTKLFTLKGKKAWSQWKIFWAKTFTGLALISLVASGTMDLVWPFVVLFILFSLETMLMVSLISEEEIIQAYGGNDGNRPGPLSPA